MTAQMISIGKREKSKELSDLCCFKNIEGKVARREMEGFKTCVTTSRFACIWQQLEGFLQTLVTESTIERLLLFK